MKEHEHPYWKEMRKAREYARSDAKELVRNSLDLGHPDNRPGMMEHPKKVAENYHDRTPSQKRSADEERHEYESRRRMGLKGDE
jgi:hypothetical protein